MLVRVIHPDAPTGKATKYARAEFERRFLLDAVPAAVPAASVRIEDRYLTGTRIRLRRATPLDGGAPTYKLTQKIPSYAAEPGLITTFYLDEAEYRVLAALPAATLSKTRHSVPPLGVDVFEGALVGLVLAEAEFGDAQAVAAFTPGVPVVAEVTHDPRFTGGRLVKTTAEQLRDLLAERRQ